MPGCGITANGGWANRHGADNLRAVPGARRLLRAMPRARRLAPTVALIVATLVAAVAPAPASAATVGISDGRPALFDSPILREVNFQHVRLVVPWDAARTAGTWTTWLERASSQGWSIMLAPTVHGAAPSTTDYEAALRQLLDRYPGIDAVEGWNEPNHAIQPTAGKPALAAAYYEAARRACASRCTAVAGNLLDAPSMGSYLSAYRAALTTTPAVWGVHNYYDTTYFQRSGIDQMLAITDGPIWLTETGGLVAFQPNGPGTGLLPDERRAADGLRWLFTVAAREPRIGRIYLYGMWQEPWNAFDSALLRVDNTEREGMAVVRQAVGPRPAAPAGTTTNGAPGTGSPTTATTTASPGSAPAASGLARISTRDPAARPVLRLVGKRITVNRATRRAEITIRCILADCTGRLTVRAGNWRYARDVRLAAGAERTITVRLTRPALRAVPRTATRTASGTATAELCAEACSRIPVTRR